MEMTKKHNACDCFGDESLFRIGMFAAMNHVTVKTLRFYEEQGLLLPAYINEENGYRIVGSIREKYIDGVWNKEDESQWLTEIQIPVEKKGNIYPR